MSTKREIVLKAFKGEAVDRVPVGFWHHFTREDEWLKGFSNPEIIEKNTTQKVVYTLYNFAGGLSKNEFSFSTDELEAMYQPSVEIEGESEQTVYLFFCIAVQSNGEIEKYYNDYKKDLESAVIQADITEVDGTEHTQYFGIRQKYETSDTPAYLELYLLEME